MLALQAVSPGLGRGVESNVTRTTRDGEGSFDPLELEDESGLGYGAQRSVNLSPTLDWVEFRQAVQVNPGLVVETTAKGDKETVVDFHVKAKRTDTFNGSMSVVDLASNLDNSHRLTLETTNFTDDHGSSIQCTVSTPLPVKVRGRAEGEPTSLLPSLDWGLSTHTRMGKNTTLFSRLFCDDVFGQQLVVQASYHVRDRGGGKGKGKGKGKKSQLLVSGLGALNFGSDVGAGFSITKLFPGEGKQGLDSSDSLELRGLCARSGNHSLSLNANFGVVVP
ncbi:hypothetical protein HOP50_01g08590 [Chloropicon primus]|uniref:Uncharacterized protein n=1 Tax=Chloropicon primus TaxID=1764295 RepID=A0A5B8MD71_9CHLO|nr:hypothetical protein A3770_01p08710 [Chloropicon primus]UPQ97564.1 hypothetical protein HOP50_01g08590 [Chloropicon primus]|eukprot:QDZ18353.1 hypothetical protein A3770_01p08710 [Chloropicon primus]